MQGGRNAELLEGLELCGDEPECRPDRLPLEVDVDTKAGEPGHGMGEVELPLELELLLLLAREDAVEELLRVLRCEGVVALEPLHVSAHANDRGCPRRHMEVR